MKYLILICLFALFVSCNKDCYNPNLEKQYEGVVCTTDCPGVIGCDGKEYCNECEANRVGVAVED